MKKVLSIIGCLVLLVSTGDALKTLARCKLRYNKNTAADVVALTNNQKLTGTIWFEEKDGATTIEGTIDGFSGANGMKHGFHIHERANTMNDCNDNGGHFNPKSVNHGAPNANTRHYGDLGNLVVQNGKAVVSAANQNAYVKLTGDDNVIGKSIVVHAGEDDLGLVDNDGSRGTGNAGKRLACCLIEAYEPVKHTATCEMIANSGGFSGTINLMQDLSQPDPADRRTHIQGVVKGFDTTDDVTVHGFHMMHQRGFVPTTDCQLQSGHYNPERLVNGHGGPGDAKRHYGDLGNIEEQNGQATINIKDDFIELYGEYNVDRLSLVVHEKTDDLGAGNHEDSSETGNAGGRLTCCQIIKDSSSATKKASSLTLIVLLVLLKIFS